MPSITGGSNAGKDSRIDIMIPHPQPNNCTHGNLCTDLNNYLKSVLPSGKYAIQKCLDINYRSCPHYCLSHTSQQSERDKVLDDYCNIDLTHYVWGDIQGDDVSLCRGKECNYCGRFNAELRQEGKQEEQR